MTRTTLLLTALLTLPASAARRAVVTHYHPNLAGKRMASGVRYNPRALTVASRSRRDLGRTVLLQRGRRRVVARVTDLGRLPVPRGFGRGKRFDLSWRVARGLGLRRNENATVTWRWVR